MVRSSRSFFSSIVMVRGGEGHKQDSRGREGEKTLFSAIDSRGILSMYDQNPKGGTEMNTRMVFARAVVGEVRQDLQD